MGDDDAGSPRRTLIFLHLPKTAGSTMARLIDRQYAPDERFQVQAGKVIDSLQHLASQDEAQRRAYKAVFGHMPYGVHKLLPQPCAYLTLLREPVDRIISTYYYILRTPHHPQHATLNERRIGLADYVRGSEIPVPHDDMTLRMCNTDPLAENLWTGSKERSRAALAQAKRNLASFAFVGLTEQFDESLAIIRQKFGWRPTEVRNQNVTADRPAVGEVDADIVAAIRESNPLDQELYAYGRELFQAATPSVADCL